MARTGATTVVSLGAIHTYTGGTHVYPCGYVCVRRYFAIPALERFRRIGRCVCAHIQTHAHTHTHTHRLLQKYTHMSLTEAHTHTYASFVCAISKRHTHTHFSIDVLPDKELVELVHTLTHTHTHTNTHTHKDSHTHRNTHRNTHTHTHNVWRVCEGADIHKLMADFVETYYATSIKYFESLLHMHLSHHSLLKYDHLITNTVPPVHLSQISGDTFFGLTLPFVSARLRAMLYAYLRAKAQKNLKPYSLDVLKFNLHRTTRWRRVKPLCVGKGEIGGVLSSRDRTQELMNEFTMFKQTLNDKGVKTSRQERNMRSASKQFTSMPPAMQYRYLVDLPPERRLEVRASRIHGFGLFVTELISEGEPVVEYVGDLIRNSIADKREKLYELEGSKDASCYLFKLDTNYVVDATTAGNLARFINHCCEPNCVCRVIPCQNGAKHIVIFAKRDIQPDEEVTYDYQFNIEEESEKIECQCGMPNCLGRMN